MEERVLFRNIAHIFVECVLLLVSTTVEKYQRHVLTSRHSGCWLTFHHPGWCRVNPPPSGDNLSPSLCHSLGPPVKLLIGLRRYDPTTHLKLCRRPPYVSAIITITQSPSLSTGHLSATADKRRRLGL